MSRETELLEENQRLKRANWRLQLEGPALERDKLIIALRTRIKSIEALLDLYKALYHLTREVLPINPPRYEVMAESILEVIERIERAINGNGEEKTKSDSGDREGDQEPGRE